MSEWSDRELGMNRAITRRDFLNGLAIGIGGAALGALQGPALRAQSSPPPAYPPSLTGLRGSTDGSFETAHALRDGTFWRSAGAATDTRETYDLVVVGGGISGLAAAYFFRERFGGAARILILDNHDDFGGHARRNEFTLGGRTLLMNGGTASINSPTAYSREADGLLKALGVEPEKLNASTVDRETYRSLGLRSAVFFDKETFGADRLVLNAGGSRTWAQFVADTPLPLEAQRDIIRLQEGKTDYMPGLSSAEKKARLAKISYRAFLLDVARVHTDVVKFYQSRTHGEWGVGIDAESALDCWTHDLPGFGGMGLEPGSSPDMSYTAAGYADGGSYRYHFPDGNASIARLLVRALIPAAVPGQTVHDVVTARARYDRLDSSDAPVRLRLNSTVVRARHLGEPASSREVEVTYAIGSKLFTVRAAGCVMACWNMVVPYLVPDLPDEQKKAMKYLVKVPLVYTSVGLRNWQAFAKLGVQNVSAPGSYHTSFSLNSIVNIGAYKSPTSPADPTLVHMTRTPCRPGLPARQQHALGRTELQTTTFETFERNIRDQLARALKGGGLDPARDIAAITVNRWPHGYGYEYNPLFDPNWAPGEAPHEIGRRRFGRITIANSDAAATAYTDTAIDQAHRAVHELFDAETRGRSA